MKDLKTSTLKAVNTKLGSNNESNKEKVSSETNKTIKNNAYSISGDAKKELLKGSSGKENENTSKKNDNKKEYYNYNADEVNGTSKQKSSISNKKNTNDEKTLGSGSSNNKGKSNIVVGVVILIFIVVIVTFFAFGGFSIFENKENVSVETDQVENNTSNNNNNNNNDNGKTNDYKLTDSNSRYYAETELQKLSIWDLYLARNEIYARHGRDFKKQDLKDYFKTKSWYAVKYTPEEFDAKSSSILNDFERKNADLMLKIEKSRNSPYLAP